jgi:hypothetical protein
MVLLPAPLGPTSATTSPGVNGQVEVADRGPTYAIRLIPEVTALGQA